MRDKWRQRLTDNFGKLIYHIMGSESIYTYLYIRLGAIRGATLDRLDVVRAFCFSGNLPPCGLPQT
jgi:hypothetical protein